MSMPYLLRCASCRLYMFHRPPMAPFCRYCFHPIRIHSETTNMNTAPITLQKLDEILTKTAEVARDINQEIIEIRIVATPADQYRPFRAVVDIKFNDQKEAAGFSRLTTTFEVPLL